MNGQATSATVKVRYSSRVVPSHVYAPDINPARFEFLRFDSTTAIPGGDSISLAFAYKPERDVGPVAIYDPVSIGEDGYLLNKSAIDLDKDGKTSGKDNCPRKSNANQADLDNDGVGDACDPDLDEDHVANSKDNCPRVWNVDRLDSYADAKGDACARP